MDSVKVFMQGKSDYIQQILLQEMMGDESLN